MASTLNIQIQTNLSQTEIKNRINHLQTRPKEVLANFRALIKGVAGGIHRAKFFIGTSAAAPVAASATITGTSVVATDAVTIGGVAFTYTASPTLSTDVLVTIGSAAALASASDIVYTTQIMTKTAHALKTGDTVRASTSSVLPAGLAVSTDYFVIRLSADTFWLSATRAGAIAGTKIALTSNGTGTQTFTPTANSCKAGRLADALNAHATIGQVILATPAANVVTVAANVPGVIGNFIALATSSGSTMVCTGSGYLASGAGGATESYTTVALGL